jgi:oxygen-independent coproporphyrinogen-3 oxidase
MAGIYLHIPFCKKACNYCNFHFSTSVKKMPEMVDAILKEIDLRRSYITETVETIYFGGGTPSLLPPAAIGQILEKLNLVFGIASNSEITLEANPDDISMEPLNGWRSAGINRLSIGVQSFFEKDLAWMNRAHNAGQAAASIEAALQYGFPNITIDLIYGSPGLSDENWLSNIERALQYQIPHISCYALTVEPKTALAKMIAVDQVENTDPDLQARQFLFLVNRLKQAGYEHYEISNFALPGFRSRHNSSYWQGKPYLGLGPSAHSFDGKSRQWNIANNAIYLQTIGSGNIPAESETLTETQQVNEYLMTSLRTIEGISIEKIKTSWGNGKAALLETAISKHQQRGYVLNNDGRIVLTDEGKFLADGIAADLFFTE